MMAEAGSDAPPEESPGFILGRWVALGYGFTFDVFRNDSGDGSEYIMRAASESDEFAYYCDLVGEFDRDPEDPRTYMGRHFWGGNKSDVKYLGADGGLLIRVLDADRLHVIFRDSKYKGGWIYERQPQWAWGKAPSP